MQKIKIYVADFWRGFKNDDNFILSALKDHYEIVLDDKNPDYLFYSKFGNAHFRYENSIKIYFTGENDVPNFNLCDYAIGSSLLNFGDRYLRLPLFAIWDGYDAIFEGKEDLFTSFEHYVQRKFCNFVYSDSQWADPIREEFFHRLSQYKKVDSGGKYLNNVGKPVADKIGFLKNYKFTIAFENSSLPGYTTEKILDPMQVNSLPIYWGNPDVEKDFNTSSFINVMEYNSIDEAIDEIIRLDNDDEAYLEKLSQPWMNEEQKIDYRAKLTDFLSHIVDFPLETAKRTTDYGYSRLYKKKQQIIGSLYDNPFFRPILKKWYNEN